MHTTTYLQHRLSLYLERLLSLCSASSATGRQLERAEKGLEYSPTYRNTAEDRMIDLLDTAPWARSLSQDDLRVLYTYQFGFGGQHEVRGEGGEVIDRWTTGINHMQAAKLLKIRGRYPAKAAHNRLLRAAGKIWKCNDPKQQLLRRFGQK